MNATDIGHWCITKLWENEYRIYLAFAIWWKYRHFATKTLKDLLIKDLKTLKDLLIKDLKTLKDLLIKDLKTLKDLLIKDLKTLKDLLIKDFHFLLMMSHFMSQYRIPPQMHSVLLTQ